MSVNTELFDLAVLRVLDANRTRFGLGIVALGHNIVSFSFKPEQGDSGKEFFNLIADRIEYLMNKGMIEEVKKTLSSENRAWRITSGGIKYVDER